MNRTLSLLASVVACSCNDHSSTVAKTESKPDAVVPADAKEIPELPNWIQLRVGRVRIAKPAVPWDGPKVEVGMAAACRAFVQTVGQASPGHSDLKDVSNFGCGLLDSQRQTDPTLPDLQVQLRTNGVVYASDIAFDQITHTFDYPFEIPAAAISASGISVTVVDADDDSTGQEIGSVRLMKEQLVDALSSRKLLSLTSQNVELLEVEVTVADGAFKRRDAKVDTAKGGMVVTAFQVSAGEVVRIEAKGHWTTGRFEIGNIGPNGWPSNTRGDNLPLFRDKPHGAAVAIVGHAASNFHTTVRENSCARFVSPVSGMVWVGVNDANFDDNAGDANFVVMKRGADLSQWSTPGVMMECL